MLKKALHYIKITVLLVSVILIWHLIVTRLFEVPDYDELGIFYTLAGTILTIYLYGKRGQI